LRLEALEDRTVPTFLTPVNYAVGVAPVAVTTAYLNNDTILDLITVNASDNTISVQLGGSNGTFQTAQTYATGSGPQSVAVGDLNGDGKVDVVTANAGDSTVSVLLGNGDGTFQTAKNYAVGSQPVSIAVGNFDGKPDIVTANQGDGTVSLLPGVGDGTFGTAKTVASFGVPAQSVAVGDLNGDGKLDLAVTTRGTDGYWWSGGWGYYGYYGGGYVPGYSPTVNVLVGNGAGTFTTANSFTLPSPYEVPPSGYAPPSVAIANLNGDSKPDLVTTDAGDGLVSVFVNNGDGTFAGPSTFGTGSSPVSVLAADLNGDGKLDLVTANSGSTLSVLPGDGKGAFGSGYTFTAGSNPASVATGDFNADGLTDLAVANSGDNNVSVLFNTGYWPALQVAATDPATGAALTSTTAGTPFNLTVTARDPSGNVLTNFTDQVSFTDWDPQATIVDPTTGNSAAINGFTYTFTAADHGAHTFRVTLKMAGTHSITVSDPSAGGTAVTTPGIAVNPAAPSSFQVNNFPTPISAGESGGFSIAAYDRYGNLATNYSGTVVLSSTDTTALFYDAYTGTQLSANGYTFVPGNDYGAHYFDAILNKAGTQSISVRDSVNSAANGSQTGIQVNLSASITGPSYGYISQPLSYTLATIGDPSGTIFTYKIDWNADGIVDQTVTGATGTTVTHAFSTVGYTNFNVTATDPNGASASAYAYVYTLPVSVAIQTNPAHTTQQILVIKDSGGNGDSIVLGSAANNAVSLSVDGYALGTIAPTNGSPFALVMAYGSSGYDTIDARNLAISSVLVGGSGNDTLYGGSARNLLIGGLGADALYAGSAGDILIGGYTSYDSNVTALAYIMAEWDRTDVTYFTRVKHLNGSLRGGLNGSYFLKSGTISDDGSVADVLNGGAGLDWFFIHKKGKHPDRVIGQTSAEVVTSI
jgi:hypothetical protein